MITITRPLGLQDVKEPITKQILIPNITHHPRLYPVTTDVVDLQDTRKLLDRYQDL
jgi:hypothetical protein